MPSLRNPVGPLPASIYWRRRIVVLAALGVVVALVCALTLGGGGNDRKAAAGSAGTPASSLTPGPTGRGGSNDGAAGGSGGSGTPSAGATGGSGTPTTVPTGAPVVTGSGGSGSGGGTGSAGAGSGSGSGGSGSGSGSGGGDSTLAPNQPGTRNLPTCAATDLDLSLVSNHQIYGPSQLPAFTLTITNTVGSACKVDLGAKSAVLSITSDTGATVWSSGFCPKDPSEQWYSLPASVPGAHPGTLSAVFGWGRTTAKAGCAPGSGGVNASAGTYVAHVAIGSSVQPYLSFKLAPFGS